MENSLQNLDTVIFLPDECFENQLLQLCTARTAWSDSVISSALVIKLVSVLFGKCTTLVVTKCWPMETGLPSGDPMKSREIRSFLEKLGETGCFIKSDRAGMNVEHSWNFCLNGDHDGPCNCQHYWSSPIPTEKWTTVELDMWTTKGASVSSWQTLSGWSWMTLYVNKHILINK